ncbi:hypothetical protein [Luteolibacter yonseiensis]|uniref:non-homologous end-joining DNA ligase LigD n=1 Tax=Luteolibacter yonseiensis TaxID=1144680 RepID=UPI003CE4A4DA
MAGQGPRQADTGIFIDWLRDGEGSTCVAPWCLRARPGAPVSMPSAWADLPSLPPDCGVTIHDDPKTPTQWMKPKFNTDLLSF